VMTTSSQEGMCTLEGSLADLIEADVISYDTALEYSSHPKELARIMAHRGIMLATA